MIRGAPAASACAGFREKGLKTLNRSGEKGVI